MKRGTSPIKTKILSDFMQKFSAKKQDKPLPNQKPNLSQASLIKDSPKQLMPTQIARSTEPTNNTKTKVGLEKSIDDMLGFGQSVPKSRYASTKPKEQPQTVSKNQSQQKSKNSTTQKQQPASQITDSVLQQSARSGQSSTSMIVNNSSMKYITKSQEKFISSPVRVLNFQDKKSQSPEIKINILEKKSISDSDFMNQTELKSKIDQIQNLTKEKSFFIDKVSKLELQLSRKDKELTRKVNQVNSTTLQREVILNFLSNLTQKMTQFLSKKQPSSQTQINPKPQLSSKSLNKSLNKSLTSRNPPKANNSFSASKLNPSKAQLESISQDKQISLVQSINIRLLDELTKSMQKGLSRSEVSKKSQELVSVFRKLLMELKRSEQALVNNIRGEYSKVEKEFQTQKQAINRVQKLYETEKGKYEKLVEREKTLSDQLQQVQVEHTKCISAQTQLNKQLQTTKLNLNKSKEELLRKQIKLSQCQERLKEFKKLPNQHNNEKEQIKRSFERLLKQKQAQILTIKKSQQKQLKLKLSEEENTKKQLYEVQKKIQQLEKTINLKQTKITQLNQSLSQRQSTIKQLTTECASLKSQLQRQSKQQQKHEAKLDNKQKQIQQLNLTLLNKDKRLLELQFTSQQTHTQLTALRQQSKQLQLNQIKLTQTQHRLKDTLHKTQLQTSYNIQQCKRWKTAYDKTQQQLLSQIKSHKTYELSSKKTIHKLQTQLQALTQTHQYMSIKLTQLQKLNLQQQKQLIHLQTTTRLQTNKHTQSTTIYQELTQIQISKYNELIKDKQTTWRNQLKLMEDKYLSLREDYWANRELVVKVNLQLQAKTSQLRELTSKLYVYVAGTDLIHKRLYSVLVNSSSKPIKNPYYSQTPLNTTTKPLPYPYYNQTPLISKDQIDKLIYDQNIELANQFRTLKPQNKKFHQLIKITLQLQSYYKTIERQVKTLQLVNSKLLKPVLAFNTQLIGSNLLEKQVIGLINNSQVKSINQVIQGVDQCFNIVLRNRNKLQASTSIKQSIYQLSSSIQVSNTSQATNHKLSSRPIHIDVNIYKAILHQQPTPQSLLQQTNSFPNCINGFPNYMQLLHKLMISLLNKLSQVSTTNTLQLQHKHQQETLQLKQQFNHHLQQTQHQLTQLRHLITIKQQQFHQTIHNLKHNQYQPKLHSLQQHHFQQKQTLNQQHFNQYQQLTTSYKQQLTSLTNIITNHQLTITQLQHQLQYQKQLTLKLYTQINQLNLNLNNQSLKKSQVLAQVNQLKVQIYNLQQYEIPRLNGRCQELQAMVSKKNEQLKQAYLIVQTHIDAN